MNREAFYLGGAVGFLVATVVHAIETSQRKNRELANRVTDLEWEQEMVKAGKEDSNAEV